MDTSGNMMSISSRCFCGTETGADILFPAGKESVCRCRSCGQVFVAGIDENDTKIIYDESEYFTQRNNYLEKQEELKAHFQCILDKIKLYKSVGVLLDVGCSVGILLDTAKSNNFEVKGVELSKWASEFARQKGFDVVTGGLTEAEYCDNTFDVVVMNHVLEHIPDPVAILSEINRVLKQDGLLVIGVPNFGSPMARLMRGDWYSLQPDQHIWQFTHFTLNNLLQRAGFNEVFFEAKENHRIVGWRPVKVLQRLINEFSAKANNAEAMLVFARKASNA